MNSAAIKTRCAGLLFLAAMGTGILSVVPSVDSTKFLTEAAANADQILLATFFQFLMALAYIGIAALLYPIVKNFGDNLSLGFLSLRVIAATLVMVGAVLLPSILALSQEYAKNPSQDASALEALGNTLKTMRDYLNHVFMILALCAGNCALYLLLLKSKLIPRWLSAWGLLGNSLSIIASVLVSFQLVGVVTTEYLVLNAPTAIQELILGIWLMAKGFDRYSPIPKL